MLCRLAPSGEHFSTKNQFKMEQPRPVELGYSLKNILTPSGNLYWKRLIEMNKKFQHFLFRLITFILLALRLVVLSTLSIWRVIYSLLRTLALSVGHLFSRTNLGWNSRDGCRSAVC